MSHHCPECENLEFSKGAQFQNERYGKGKRVFNRCKRTNSSSVPYRCTICGHIHYSGEDIKKSAKSA